MPEQRLSPFPPSLAGLSCGVTCLGSAPILHSSALPTERHRDSGKQYQKRQGLVGFFLPLGKFVWKIQKEMEEPPVNTYTKYTPGPHCLDKVQ